MKKLLIGFFSVLVMVCAISATQINTNEVQAKESKDYVIKVNLGTNCTTIYKKGKAVKAMICSPSSETPAKTFYIPVKYRWHEMIGNCYAQYCSRISYEYSILFHSVWYYRNGDKSSMSVGAYNVMGQKASHGCVRLLCKDAKWIYDHCAVGTKVVIFWGTKKDDPLGRPSFSPIRTGAFMSWDPTDPDPNNPYNKLKPIIKANTTAIEYGSKVSPLSLVTIKSSTGEELTRENAKISFKGKINTKKLGTYKIKYTAKDSLGHERTTTLKFKVVDTKKPVLKGVKDKKNVALYNTVDLLKGAKAKMVSGKDLTNKIKVSVKYKNKRVKVSKGKVNFGKTGTYKIKYSVTGQNNKTTTKTVKYIVKDHRVKLTLSSKTVEIQQGDSFDPLSYVKELTTYTGAKLNISKYVTIDGDVDANTPGTYIVTFSAKQSGKDYTTRTAQLTVVVKEKTVEEPIETPEESEIIEGSGEPANGDEGWTENQ